MTIRFIDEQPAQPRIRFIDEQVPSQPAVVTQPVEPDIQYQRITPVDALRSHVSAQVESNAKATRRKAAISQLVSKYKTAGDKQMTDFVLGLDNPEYDDKDVSAFVNVKANELAAKRAKTFTAPVARNDGASTPSSQPSVATGPVPSVNKPVTLGSGFKQTVPMSTPEKQAELELRQGATVKPSGMGPLEVASMSAVRSALPSFAQPEMTDVEQQAMQERPWSSFAGTIAGGLIGLIPFLKGAKAAGAALKVAETLAPLQKALPTIGKYAPVLVEQLAGFAAHDQVFLPLDADWKTRADTAAKSAETAVLFTASGGANKYVQPIANAALGYGMAKESGESDQMAAANALVFAAMPYVLKDRAKAVGSATDAAVKMGTPRKDAAQIAEQIVSGIEKSKENANAVAKGKEQTGRVEQYPQTDTRGLPAETGGSDSVRLQQEAQKEVAQPLSVQPTTTTPVGATAPKIAESGPTISTQEKPNAPIQEVQAERPVVPAGSHEINTVTRAAELSDGKGPFAPEAQQSRESGANIKKNTPVRAMVDTAMSEATTDPSTALKNANDAIDPVEKAAKYVGYLEARKARGEVATDAFNRLAREGSTAGTVLRIMRELKLGTPEGRADTWMQLFSRWSEKAGAKLSKEKNAEIRSNFERAEAMDEGVAREEATQNAIDYAVLQVPRTSAAWKAFRYSNVLSNPRSHIRNFVGNAMQLGVVRPLALAFSGDFKGAYRFSKAAAQNIGKGFDAFIGAMKGAAGPSKTFETIGTSVFDAAMQKRLPAALTFVNRAMEGGDLFARAMIEAGETARLVKSGVKPELAEARAREISEQYLYRNKLGVEMKDQSQSVITRAIDAGGHLLEGARNLPVLGKIFDPVLLFLRTPFNISKSGIKTSPLGFLGDLTLDGVSKGRYKKPFSALTESEQITAKDELKNRVGLARLGLGVMAIGSALAMTQRTTWAAPRDEKEKKLFYDSGRKPYSVLIGDKWVPMWTFGPLGVSLAIPAAMRDVFIDNPKYAGEDAGTKMLALAQNMAKFVITQSPFSSVQSFMENVTGDVYDPGKFLAFTAQQYLPASGFINYVNQWIDPTYRKAKGFTQNLKANIPWLSQDIPAHETSADIAAQRTLMDIIPPFSIGQNDQTYTRLYWRRNEELKANKLRGGPAPTLSSLGIDLGIPSTKQLIGRSF